MNIRELRKSHNMTQQDLADAMGVSTAIISRYESGAAFPRKRNLQKLAEIFGMSISELLEEDNKAYYQSQESILVKEQETLNEYNQFIRPSEKLKFLLISQAEGKCELCGQDAPFYDHGLPFLQLSHVIPLSENGKFVPGNVVVLCPNCNLKTAVLKDPEDRKLLLEKAKKHHW